MLIKLLLAILFLLIAGILYWLDKIGRINLGKWDNIVTIALGILAALTLVLPAPSDDAENIATLANTALPETEQIRVDNEFLAIEELGLRVDSYHGGDRGEGSYEITNQNLDGEAQKFYTFKYELSDTTDYAGLIFEFTNPQDISDYNYIELSISFSDDRARCNLFIRDETGKQALVLLGDGFFASALPIVQNVRIPLNEYFSEINLNSVNLLGCDANGTFTLGNRSFSVARIRFVK